MKRAKQNRRNKRLLDIFAHRKSPNYLYLKGFYDSIKVLEPRDIPSDFTFEIEGFEQNYLLRNEPWPDVLNGK